MRRSRVVVAFAAFAVLAAACGSLSDEGDPLADLRPVSPDGRPDLAEPAQPPASVFEAQEAEIGETVETSPNELIVQIDGVGAPFDRRLLGTNIPAWLGPERDSLAFYHPAIELAGVEMLRFPGGSWSNNYAWLDCLDGGPECRNPWAMSVVDFARVMSNSAPHIEFMWTARFSGTPEESAALVAFFNGSVGDETRIGVDRNGVDWGTVDRWARRRAGVGFPDPLPIRYWEIGNEIYGAIAEAGPDCAAWGWEDVATCEGDEYVEGTPDQAGFLEFAAAMRAVDPSIEIGAVGVAPTGGWGNFGNEVLAYGGREIDFYVVHWYGFGDSPGVDAALASPAGYWPEAMRGLARDVAEWGLDEVPVAVTEYNLVSFREGDTDAVMHRAVNAFFLTETIGEMARSGVAIANHWNLFDERDANATSYGMVEANTGEVLPSFFAMRAWSLMGETLRPVVGGMVNSYATSSSDGSVQVLLVNPSASGETLTIEIAGGAGSWTATADVLTTTDLWSAAVAYNGQPVGLVEELVLDPVELGAVGAVFDYAPEPFSITVLRLTPS